ncbi:MAG: multicomponent Na+:H+ antiporter subunit F [bacterium]|jgi:multicomponent Na+:H+ antiporter subunit F
MGLSITIALAFTAFGLVAACIRMFKGPTAADRIVALDLVTILLVAISSLLALQLDNSAYLDLGLALALVGFLATVAFARYLETNPKNPLEDVDAAQKTDNTEADITAREQQ